MKSIQNEPSWDKRVSRKRIGGDCVRREARCGGGRRAVQSREICRRFSCCGDSVLLERSGSNTGRRRSRGSAAESVCAAGDKTVLCNADAVVRARANKDARKVYGNTRSLSGGV